MVASGAFGGFLNYLHNFDTTENEKKNKLGKYKYIFLGIGAAFLVPVFLKMIASDLIKPDPKNFDNICYLIFAGFCLIAAIFSKRFITTIGEKILEKAEKAEKVGKENKQQIETTKLELTSTQERIEDVKLAVNLKNQEPEILKTEDKKPPDLLIQLVNSYVQRTSVPDYTERLKLKAELGRKMGQIICSYNLSKEELLNDYQNEGMYLALAYSVELRPTAEALLIINKLSKAAKQLYTKYVILVAYRTLASSGFIKKPDVKNIYELILKFRANADNPLLRNINDTINVLRFIDPEIGKTG
jgi:hypothetical protein